MPRRRVIDHLVRRPCPLVDEEEVVERTTRVYDEWGVFELEVEPPLQRQELPF